MINMAMLVLMADTLMMISFKGHRELDLIQFLNLFFGRGGGGGGFGF